MYAIFAGFWRQIYVSAAAVIPGRVRSTRTRNPDASAEFVSGFRAQSLSGPSRNDRLKSSSERDDLARIHDVLRVERALDRRHGGQRRCTMLGQEIFHLALSHAVLAGAGAVHGQCQFDDAL